VVLGCVVDCTLFINKILNLMYEKNTFSAIIVARK